MGKILSIIVPSYNMEAYLPKCLGSLVVDDEELLEKLDVIVVNDGSKDRTSAIAHEFTAKYPGVFRVIDKKNSHYGSCINAALPVALGTYVKILDADDWFDTGNLSGFMRFLDSRSGDVDLVISDYEVVDAEGNITAYRDYDFPKNAVFGIREFSRTSRYLSMHAFAYRTDAVRSMGYRQLEGVSYTDTEWILLPMVGVSKIAYCPFSVYRYLRGREGQSMEEGQIAKSFWMRAELALDMLRQYERLKAFASKETREYLEARLLDAVEGIYRGGIFGFNGLSAKIDLDGFDHQLKTDDQKLYHLLGTCSYCRRIPYRYINGWRFSRGTVRFSVMLMICRLYSWFAVRCGKMIDK